MTYKKNEIGPEEVKNNIGSEVKVVFHGKLLGYDESRKTVLIETIHGNVEVLPDESLKKFI